MAGKKGYPMSKGKGAKKKDMPYDGDMDKEEEEGEDMKDKSEGLTGDDLQKSLDKLEEFASAEDAPTRKEELLAKAQEGDLEKSEREELFQLLGGELPAATESEAQSVNEEIAKSMTGSDDLQQALDVSDYLREQHDALTKSLQTLGDRVEQSDRRRHDFSLVLAKAVSDIGQLTKSVAERLCVIEDQPARGPKSKGIQAQPLQKSFAGESPAEETLRKSDILDALDGLHMESLEKGHKGRINGGDGEDILRAIGKFEQTSKVSPQMMSAVQDYRKRNGTAAH
jgi:hypothetical protein